MDIEKLKNMCEYIDSSLEFFADKEFVSEKHEQTYKDFLEFTILSKLEEIKDINVLRKVLMYEDEFENMLIHKFYNHEMMHLIKFVLDVCKNNEELRGLLYCVTNENKDSLYERLQQDEEICHELFFMDFYQNEVDDDLKNVNFVEVQEEKTPTLSIQGLEC